MRIVANRPLDLTGEAAHGECHVAVAVGRRRNVNWWADDGSHPEPAVSEVEYGKDRYPCGPRKRRGPGGQWHRPAKQRHRQRPPSLARTVALQCDHVAVTEGLGQFDGKGQILTGEVGDIGVTGAREKLFDELLCARIEFLFAHDMDPSWRIRRPELGRGLPGTNVRCGEDDTLGGAHHIAPMFFALNDATVTVRDWQDVDNVR